MPLANDYRPTTIEEMVGQKHLLGENKPINNFIKNKFLPNMILYGPPGTGKTTLAKILATAVGKNYREINGVQTSTDEIKSIIRESKETGNILLFIDEIQYLNKKVQQLILESIEFGGITLIAATADNPYFAIYKVIVSRCALFEFKMLSVEDIKQNLIRVLKVLCEQKEITISNESETEEVLNYLSEIATGDVRNSLNNLELCFYMGLKDSKTTLTMEHAKEVCFVMVNYDKDGDSHYDLLSAFHKSMRGSDENAAIHYLARLLTGENQLNDICRRILCVASEDIGMANPQAVVIAKTCVDSALQLGMPEARLPLAEAVIYLCLQPKSNSAYLAINEAMEDIQKGNYSDIPLHLKDAHYEGSKELNHGVTYQYPHNFKNHWVNQEYLPEKLKDTIYYKEQDTKNEKAYKSYWEQIKHSK